MCNTDELRVIVPYTIDAFWQTEESVIEEILERYNNYGIKEFILSCPCGGWRSVGYPSKAQYLEYAEKFKSIKEKLSKYKDIELSWWVCLTIKNGGSFDKIVKKNGEEHAISSCPLDPEFIKRFSQDIAMFAAVAKPAFIITEDDYSLLASNGCYCERHLNEFARRMGKYYTREEVIANCHAKTEEGIEFTKQWRKLRRDSLVGLAEAVRKELDKDSPEIPMGYAQSGYALADGDVTEPIARAFAGKNHRPFVRFHGTGYGNFDQKRVPYLIYSPLFEKQRLSEDFIFIHESDTFPHMRYYRSGKQMRTLMANVYSYGYDGSLFICNQLLDKCGEEDAYVKMFKQEKARFTTASKLAKMCNIRGVEIKLDPFYNTLLPYDGSNYPYWIYSIGRFGIPFSTKDEPVVFWDINNARFCDDEAVKKNLSKTIFLDALAAKKLCERGFGEYLGVNIGEYTLEKHKKLQFDLGSKEVICQPFLTEGTGRVMHTAYMYSPDGTGEEFDIEITNKACKVITELRSNSGEVVTPAMTCFKNSLGGNVVVLGMGITVANKSQSLFNYRRQRLIQNLIKENSDEYVIAVNEPDILVVQNEAKNSAEAGFTAMITLTNLCDDDLEKLSLVLPTKYKNKTYLKMNLKGEFEPIEVELTEDGITLCEEFSGLETKYILIK